MTAAKKAAAPRKSAAKRSAAAPKTDKRKVTMKSVGMAPDGTILEYVATDYVPEGMLDVYVADARTRWQFVDVADGYDAGPGGVDGETVELAHLAGREVEHFTQYGDARTPDVNALDEHVAAVARAGNLAAAEAARTTTED